MPVQPIRLFGDPVLRTPAEPVVDFDKELRHARQGPHGDDARRPRRRPGRAADRRRPAGVHLPRGRRAGVTWSTRALDLSDEEEDGRRGLPVVPRARLPDRRRVAAWSPRAQDMHGEPVTIEGTELLARCVQHETDHLDGILFIDRLDRDQRKLALKAIREAEWAGQAAPPVKVSPARPARPGALAAAAACAGLRRHPRGRRPVARRPARRPGHEVVAVAHPPGRAGRPGPHGRRSPVAERADAARRRGAAAAPAADPDVPGPAARARAGLLPGRRVRRPGPPQTRSTIPPHGWVNLHFSLLPAWRGAAPVQHARAARRRGHRRDDVPARGGPGHRPGLRRR